MSKTTAYKFAVCPRIEPERESRVPKLFQSERAAKYFLNSEIRPGPVELEAQACGLSIEEVRKRRAVYKAQKKEIRAGWLKRIKSGEVHPLQYPTHLYKILNKNQGWQDPVPVVRVADYPGPKCNRTVRDFLPINSVGPMPALALNEEIKRAFEGRSADYVCFLHDDWRFKEIEADAWQRVGHEYAGRHHTSIGEIVVKAIYDLEAAFQRLHPNASCRAVADFWRSWQVQEHIAEFCMHLADSETAGLFFRNPYDAAEETRRARMHMYRQLAAFSHELHMHSAQIPEAVSEAEGTLPSRAEKTEETASIAEPEMTRLRPGPRPKPEVSRRVREIVKQVARNSNWRDADVLDEICEALEEASIPHPRKWSANWSLMTAISENRALAKKAIEYHLKSAGKNSSQT